VDKRELIVVNKYDTLKHALDILSKEKLLSLPVVANRQFYGFLDVLDIVRCALNVWKKESIALDETHFPTDKLFNMKVIDALAPSNPVYIHETSTVGDAIEVFRSTKNASHLRRLAVIRKGLVVNVISQSDIIKFAAKHIDSLPPKLVNLQLGNIKGFIRSPIMVRIDSPFVEALHILFSNNISGLALVDHQFKLAGNLSASDLRGLNVLAFDFFMGSTLQFMVKGTSESPKAAQHLEEGNTFGEVLQLLATEKLHRLYITDENDHPIGFASLIDVIARL